MIKHSKRTRAFALKSLIVLAVLMMILSVVPGEAQKAKCCNSRNIICCRQVIKW